MQIKYEPQSLDKIETPALVTYAFENENRIEGALAELDAATGGRLKELANVGELTGKTLEMTLLHAHAPTGPRRDARPLSTNVGAGTRPELPR